VAATVETVVAAVDAAETADTIAINHTDFLKALQSPTIVGLFLLTDLRTYMVFQTGNCNIDT
jgi:hypothetical protein